MEEQRQLRVVSGSRLVIELLDVSGKSEKLDVIIVPDRAADFSHGLLGESTPLGKTLLNQPAGALLAYRIGDLNAVRILSISDPQEENIVELSAERRQQEAEKNRREIARQNAANFAASFSGKWGDYDPDGMANWDLKSDDEKPSPDK